MGLDDFKGQNKDELSMIEVARAILQDSGKRMAFADIVNAVQNFLGKSDEEIRERLPQFYTDMNTDGEFISMGDNVWALRSWFPYESVDEEVNHPEDEDDVPRKKHHKKVNAFIGDSDDDDIIQMIQKMKIWTLMTTTIMKMITQMMILTMLTTMN